MNLGSAAVAAEVGRTVRMRSRPLPMVGWVMISRAELAQAQRLLLGEQEGIVDELGLLTIHQAVADRLFPGTSVLHTRLRYALFVPWLMRIASTERDPAKRLRELEFALTGLLKAGTANDKEARKGIIGGRIHPGRPAAQPASYAYWTALASWGILGRHFSETLPSREIVLEQLSSLGASARALDSDGQPLLDQLLPFHEVPPMPEQLLAGPGIDFRLTSAEKEFLVLRLSTIKAPLAKVDSTPRRSLLANLAAQPLKVDPTLPPWKQLNVLKRATAEDREVLLIAEGLSALAGVARASYLAMVEQACHAIGMEVGRRHRDHLTLQKQQLGASGLALDMSHVRELGVLNDGEPVVELLEATQRFLKGTLSLSKLQAIYSVVECSRKGPLSRLAGTHGASGRLRDWARTADDSKLAEPLHFRWPNVVRLLKDLHA